MWAISREERTWKSAALGWVARRSRGRALVGLSSWSVIAQVLGLGVNGIDVALNGRCCVEAQFAEGAADSLPVQPLLGTGGNSSSTLTECRMGTRLSA